MLAEAGTVADMSLASPRWVRGAPTPCSCSATRSSPQQSQQIAQAALKHRMPSIFILRAYAEAGGLMSYGAPIVDNFRRAATYVDKILKGANAGELPFEQPRKYELAINMKTAKALGLTIPQSLLLRVDHVVQ